MKTRFRKTLFLCAATLLCAAVLGLTASPVTAGNPSSSAYLTVDADPSDGCGTIQGSAFVPTGSTVTVGICLMEAASAPVSGFISGATLGVTYISPLSASDVVGNGTTDLDANPNWAEASVGGAAAWDCNTSNTAGSAPSASPSPATITCVSVGGVDRAVSGAVLLATLTFDAPSGTGTSPLIWDSTSLTVGSGGSQNPSCGFGIVCIGASIIVQTATPTAIATPTNTHTPTNTTTSTYTPTPTDTATSTHTPTPTNTYTPTPSPTPCTSNGTPTTCPTATSTSTSSVVRTHTPTATRTRTQTASASTTPSSPTAPAIVGTQPAGGAGAGGQSPIQLPGTGKSGAIPDRSPYVWLALGLAVAAALGAGMLVTGRSRRL